MFTYGLTGTATVAMLLMGYGFRQWHTMIQPKQDEYFNLQLQKLNMGLFAQVMSVINKAR